MKTAICKSGIRGWRCKLQSNYTDLAEWKRYAETYSLHSRLGYKTPELAWQANPTIEGSVNPGDFRKSPKS